MAYYLEVDGSQVVALCNQLAEQVGQERAQRILNRTIYKTAKTMNVPIAKALHSVYTAPSAWIKSGFMDPHMGGNQCVIPLSGFKGPIGRVFPRKGTKKHIAVEIIKGQTTKLPPLMKHQGGNPPVRSGAGVNTTSASGGHPRVTGISVPQMPLPAAKGNKPTEKVIEDRMMKILEQSCHAILGGYTQY